jgi:hypothetical protein
MRLESECCLRLPRDLALNSERPNRQWLKQLVFWAREIQPVHPLTTSQHGRLPVMVRRHIGVRLNGQYRIPDTTSNLSATGKELAISWQKPFDRLVKLEDLTAGDLHRGKPRTAMLARTIIDHVEQEMKRAAANDNQSTDRLTA